MRPGSHFISMSCTCRRSMHYVSPLSPGSPHASKPVTFSYFGRSRSPVSHRSRYMNHIRIYPFSDVLCPQWALGATSYQCSRSIHYVSPLSPGSHQALTPFTFSYFGRSGSLRAIGATIWTTPRSIHFQTIYVPSEPWEPLHINVLYI